MTTGSRSEPVKIVSLRSGCDLYLLDQGSGTPSLFVPGWGYTTAVFDPLMAYAPAGQRILAYDPRGHGRSSAVDGGHTYVQHGEDLHALIEALSLDDVQLVGWSLGVYDVLCYLERFGAQKVRRLVLVDESPRIVGDRNREWCEGSQAEVDGMIAAVRADFPGFFAQYMRSGFSVPPDDAIVDAFVSLACRLTATQAAALLVDAQRYDFTDLITQVSRDTPTALIVRGDWASQALAWRARQGLEDRVPLHVLGGHLMLMEHPEDFAGLVFASR